LVAKERSVAPNLQSVVVGGRWGITEIERASAEKLLISPLFSIVFSIILGFWGNFYNTCFSYKFSSTINFSFEVQFCVIGLSLESVLALVGDWVTDREVKTELQLFQDWDSAGAMAVTSLSCFPQKQTLSVAPAFMGGQRLHWGLRCAWRWGDGKGNN